jgi:hypothetical protein
VDPHRAPGGLVHQRETELPLGVLLDVAFPEGAARHVLDAVAEAHGAVVIADLHDGVEGLGAAPVHAEGPHGGEPDADPHRAGPAPVPVEREGVEE